MKKVNVIIIRTAGTNCDQETAFAFRAAHASVDLIHINRLLTHEVDLARYHIMAIPGGFTYGDDIASGKILANELRFKLFGEIRSFIASGKLIIGICNGFQVLVKCGLLPNVSGDYQTVDATLTFNDSGKFEDRWVYLRQGAQHATHMRRCVWTKGIDEIITLPVAHGEGKFIPKDQAVLDRIRASGLVVFTYCDPAGSPAGYPWNPNGSVDHIAGMCDRTGRVFGLMPHPERHIHASQHPRWTRDPGRTVGDGFRIFMNGVSYIRNNL